MFQALLNVREIYLAAKEELGRAPGEENGISCPEVADRKREVADRHGALALMVNRCRREQETQWVSTNY